MNDDLAAMRAAFDPKLDAEIDKWVAEHLTTSPEWTKEQLVALGDLVGMDFRPLQPHN